MVIAREIIIDEISFYANFRDKVQIKKLLLLSSSPWREVTTIPLKICERNWSSMNN